VTAARARTVEPIRRRAQVGGDRCEELVVGNHWQQPLRRRAVQHLAVGGREVQIRHPGSTDRDPVQRLARAYHRAGGVPLAEAGELAGGQLEHLDAVSPDTIASAMTAPLAW